MAQRNPPPTRIPSAFLGDAETRGYFKKLNDSVYQMWNTSGSTGTGNGDMLGSNNLSDVGNASTSRFNLGVAIGTNVQAWTAVLDATTASYTSALNTKLSGIEALADVTDEANVVTALDGATLSAVTVASSDKVIIQDVSASDALKTVTAQSIADLGGGGGGGEAVKVWVNFDGTGTIAINDSFNVTSITDNGTGWTTITIATDFANADYAVVGSAQFSLTTSTQTTHAFGIRRGVAQTVGAVDVQTAGVLGSSSGGSDCEVVCVAMFGDQ